ncbi:MAG: hypothetical protein IKU07_01810 [Oscillospiraceae bacterium]|nr:hypothetical protein [Oscillospiraceae bacterium]
MNLYHAWVYTLQKILTAPETTKLEDYLELRNLTVTFSAEDCPELFANERVMCDYGEMRKVFFTQEANAFGHNYANCILGPKMRADTAMDDIVQMLTKNASTRKAVLTFLPYGEDKVPCINQIHFLVRNNKLEITYFSRGQDIYRKFPCDAMCIRDFGESVAKALGIDIASITAMITSAHIYEKDLADTKKLIACCYNKKVILTGNPKKYMDYEALLQRNNISLLVSSLDIPEIQSTDPCEVVKKKAEYAYAKYGFPVWVDDMSLSLDAYPAFPGAYTKSVFHQLGIEGLQALLHGRSKAATITCRLCAFDGKKHSVISGENKGCLNLGADIHDPKMPLNSIFVGEGHMAHRNKAIAQLIDRCEDTYS